MIKYYYCKLIALVGTGVFTGNKTEIGSKASCGRKSCKITDFGNGCHSGMRCDS